MRKPSEHTFDTIWGHDPIKALVRGMLEGGRLPHALLLHGADGVGKRSLAFAIAKMIFSSGIPPARSATITAPPPARFRWTVGDEPLRSPDDDLFGGAEDDLFGDLGGGPEPEPTSEPKPEAKAAKPSVTKPGPPKKPAPLRSELGTEEEAPLSGPVELNPRVDRMVARCYPIEYADDVAGILPFVDLNIIEPVGKSRAIKVDQIRALQDIGYLAPMEGRYRVVMIFGADTITASAANSLLKLLEEPPSYLRLILVTDHYNRVLETIRSRCAAIHCHPLERDYLTARLVQDEGFDASQARVAATLAGGRPSAALDVLTGSLLQQRRDIFEARLGIDRVGPVALPYATHRVLSAAGGLAPGVLLLMALARDRLVHAHAPRRNDLLVNADLEDMLGEIPPDTFALLEEMERLEECLLMDNHPLVPAPEPALELALWPG